MFVGPFPHIFVSSIHVFFIFTVMNIILFSIAVSLVRFSYIFIFKALPNLNDSLLDALIVRIIMVWSICACAFKTFFEEKHTITYVSCLIMKLFTHPAIHFFLENHEWNLVLPGLEPHRISIGSFSCFDFPRDKYFFKFGHQVHKNNFSSSFQPTKSSHFRIAFG